MAARLYFLLICAICIEYGETSQLETRVKKLENDLYVEKSRVQGVIKKVRATQDFIKNNANITEELDEVKLINIKLLEELNEVKAETKRTIDKQNYQIVENKEEILLLRALITEMNQKIKDLHPSTTTTATQQTTTEQDPSTTTVTTVTTQQSSTTVPVVLPQCPDGWKKFQSTCYLFVKKRVTWTTASSRCSDRDGILAEVDTGAKLQFLSQITGGRDVWVGGTDRQTEGTWLWSNSRRPVNSSLWAYGQPNSYSGNDDCLLMNNREWYDMKCSIMKWFVCEKQANI